MAQRRMFTLKIVDSDAFLDMPVSSQVLYFHLAMRADDDGFIGNPKKIMRVVGTNEDDMKVLISKRFILTFQSGVIVVKHWKMHNYIQSDRYSPTQYVEEKKALSTKENGSYTERIQNGYTLEPQVRLGKVRLGKVKNTSSPDGDGIYTKDFLDFWKEYPRKVGKGSAYKAWLKVKDVKKIDIIAAVIVQRTQAQWKKDGGQYIPHPTTWLNERRWEDEIIEEKKVVIVR